MNPPAQNNQKIGVAIIGTGFGKTTQLPAFRATAGCQVVGVLSHSREKAEGTAKEFGIPNAFTADEYDRFLEIKDLDLVCVTSPPNSHRDYTIRALKAGKHVLCDKPTAMNASEAREMAAAARDGKLLALIDHELRFDPVRRLFRDLVTEGYLGHLYHVNLSVESPLRLNAERPWSWWSDESQGGGFLGAIGSHVVDSVRYTFGEIQRGRAQLRTFVGERPLADGSGMRPVTSDDYADLWLELEDNATVAAVLSSSSRVPEPGWRMAAHGSDGSLILKPDGTLLGQQTGDDGFTDLTPEAVPFDAQELGMMDNMWSRAFIIYAAEIISHLALGKIMVPLAANFEDGLRSQEVLDALRQSHRESNWISCQPGESVPTG